MMSEKRISKYTVIYDEHVQVVWQKVNATIALGDGWEPFGGIAYGKDQAMKVWAQAMVKYEG
jgi:hypothetical protein